ncbi:MAG: 3-deoxy-manno-octulosonate cytidylyltransferase [Synergistaceae bacterium]|nr:3-deoxy-manno-octulosonate cytidylyltransferase [Synergistaceae bacterium]
MRILGVIPSRYNSTRLSGKPLADILGKPMLRHVYERAQRASALDGLVGAVVEDRVSEMCRIFGMNYIMTSSEHDTPTSRIYEVSQHIDADYYEFISGDEPLIDIHAVNGAALEAEKSGAEAVNAMTKVESASEIIDPSNIKVAVDDDGFLLYATRSIIPYPKGSLDFDYMKFVGIGVFSRRALEIFNNAPRSRLEKIEDCDLLRFIINGVRVKMVEVKCRSLSVDTPKDLEYVRTLMVNEAGHDSAS